MSQIRESTVYVVLECVRGTRVTRLHSFPHTANAADAYAQKLNEEEITGDLYYIWVPVEHTSHPLHG